MVPLGIRTKMGMQCNAMEVGWMGGWMRTWEDTLELFCLALAPHPPTSPTRPLASGS